MVEHLTGAGREGVSEKATAVVAIGKIEAAFETGSNRQDALGNATQTAIELSRPLTPARVVSQVSSRFDMGLVFLCADRARLATDAYKTALGDLGPFTGRRKHGLLYVAQFDPDDACARYSPDTKVATEIRDLLKEEDYQATSDER